MSTRNYEFGRKGADSDDSDYGDCYGGESSAYSNQYNYNDESSDEDSDFEPEDDADSSGDGD